MAETPIRAVVVDDEPAAREAVVTLLSREPTIEVAGIARDGRDAVSVIHRVRPDLLFLDVQMPDLDGFQVLEALGDRVPPGVVFVTAHDEHAVRAFEVHALDYLMKPFGAPRFRAAAARAIERLRALDALTQERAHAALGSATPPRAEEAGTIALAPESRRSAGGPPAPRRFGVRHGSRTTVVDVDSVDWLEACGDYVRLQCGEQSYLVSESLQNLERMLAPAEFTRIHRSTLVNLGRVLELHREPDGSGAVVLQGGVRLRVARGRWEALQGDLGLLSM